MLCTKPEKSIEGVKSTWRRSNKLIRAYFSLILATCVVAEVLMREADDSSGSWCLHVRPGWNPRPRHCGHLKMNQQVGGICVCVSPNFLKQLKMAIENVGDRNNIPGKSSLIWGAIKKWEKVFKNSKQMLESRGRNSNLDSTHTHVLCQLSLYYLLLLIAK